jgi:CDP-diacylglycerol--serine O-phosphatidyltransferase
MSLKKHIPNALTCCNLLCGCFGIILTFEKDLISAFYFVIIAAILDFFDGFAARMLKVSSPIGKDLDSLADMVTFGVLPGFVMYQMIYFSMQTSFISYSNQINGEGLPAPYALVYPLVAFLLPVFSALRLAKFNHDTRQADGFIGVATPANTLLISSLGYIQNRMEAGDLPSFIKDGLIHELLTNVYALSSFTVFMSFLMVAEIPMFALKFKHFGWNGNKLRYTLLISATLLLILFQLSAIPFIIFLYILLSVINNIITRKKQTNA